MRWWEWIVRVEQRNDEYVSSIKLILFSLVYFTLVANYYDGEHLSVGIGIYLLEIAILLSIWRGEQKEEALDGQV